MRWSIFAIVVALCVIAEVVAANYGVALPLLCVCAFYFTMRYGAMRVFTGLFLAAALLDGVWMHRFPSQFLGVLAVILLSGSWRKYGDLGSGLSLGMSGICIGVISWLSHLLGMLASSGHALTWRAVLRPLPSQLFAAVLLTPTMAFLLNYLLRRRVAWLSDQVDDRQ